MRFSAQAGILLAALMLAAPSSAQSPEQGRLLVATPDIDDASWAETVVLLLHHDENGTLGVAVNRPTWVEPQAVQPELGALEGYDGGVFRGGPAAPTRMIFLVRDPPPDLLDAAPILGDVYAGGDLRVLERLVSELDGDDASVRIYAGHAEWAPGQLEREIAAGQWEVLDANAERVFSPEPEALWHVLRAGGDELLVGRRDRQAHDRQAVEKPLSPLPRTARREASTYPR